MIWTTLKKYLKGLVKEEKGQGMVEYGLILALIAIVVIGALQLMGTSLSGMLGDAANAVSGASGGTQ